MTIEVRRMTACRKYGKQFSAYLDGELPSKKQLALSVHLAICAACRRELAALEALGPALSRLKVAPPPTHLTSRIVTTARRQQAERASGRSVRFWLTYLQSWSWGFKAAGAAAMLVVMLYIGQLTSTRGWLPGLQDKHNPMVTATSTAEGLEWFEPAPPGSILSGYLAMAGQALPSDGTHR
jgi:anti-sigma factor RsiW